MKKYLFLALAATALLAGCNKKNVVDDTTSDSLLDEGITTPERIQLGTSATRVEAETKGSGQITGITWANPSTIYVVGVVNDEVHTDLDHIELTANTDGTVTGLDDVYYDAGSVYSFYGYYLDGTATNTGTDDIAITIDGAQDIMAAKTNPKNDYTTAMSVWVTHPDYSHTTLPGIKGLTNSDEHIAKYFYTEQSSRRFVVPNLVFSHMLSAFNFHIIAGDSSADPITLAGLTVGACPTGKLTVVSDTQAATADRVGEALTETDVITVNVTPGTLEGEDTTPDVALLYPGASSFDLKISFSQNGKDQERTVTVEAPDGGVFEANTQYNVTVKVYGNEVIVLSTTIEPWGTVVDLDPIDPDEII